MQTQYQIQSPPNQLKHNQSLLMIDNVSQQPTPEGLMLTLVPAGVMPRVSAWLLDCMIRGVILIVCYVPLMWLDLTGVGLFLILLFVVNWLYPVLFEVWRDGMTPGKKRNGIYVCHDDGTPISLQSSMIRNLLRVVDSLPFLYSVGVLSLMFNRKSQRLGDMVAGTMVVYQEQDDISNIYQSLYRFIDHQAKPTTATANHADNHNEDHQGDSYDLSSPIFSFPLNLSEQQALLSLSDRLQFLPQNRQEEITNHLSPLVQCHNKLGVLSNNNQQLVYQAVLARASQLRGTS